MSHGSYISGATEHLDLVSEEQAKSGFAVRARKLITKRLSKSYKGIDNMKTI